MAYEFSLRRSRIAAKFPNRIREFRIRAGWNQRELAGKIAVPRSTMASWERGQFLPALPAAIQLAKALGTFVEALYQDAVTILRPRAKKN